uniref:hypothetical protein n=1 Tax=Mesorhizobium sp. GbtcB19 TaxID=2824764 RepID=UPI001C30F68C
VEVAQQAKASLPIGKREGSHVVVVMMVVETVVMVMMVPAMMPVMVTMMLLHRSRIRAGGAQRRHGER